MTGKFSATKCNIGWLSGMTTGRPEGRVAGTYSVVVVGGNVVVVGAAVVVVVVVVGAVVVVVVVVGASVVVVVVYSSVVVVITTGSLVVCSGAVQNGESLISLQPVEVRTKSLS